MNRPMWYPTISLIGAATRTYARLDKAGVFNIILLAFLSLIIYHIGKTIIKRFKVNFSSPAEQVAFSLAIGLGIVIYSTFFLGLLGLLYGWLFRFLILSLALWFIRDIIGYAKNIPPYTTKLREHLKSQLFHKRALFAPALCLILSSYLIMYLTAALAPEVEFDPLNYHLGVLRLYLSNHRIVAVPTNFCSNYPFGMQMIFLFGWLIKDVYLGKLFHFFCGTLVILSIYAFCKRYASPEIGMLAAVIFYAAPIIGLESKSAFIELGLAYVTFLAVYAILNWCYTNTSGWFYLSGIFSGLALSMKYGGVVCCIAVLPVIVYKVIRSGVHLHKTRELVKRLLIFLTMASILFVPWLIKNYVFTHNPVSPLLNGIFPNEVMSAEMEEGWMTVVHWYRYFEGKSLSHYLLPLIWDITVQGKCSGLIGPLFLLFIPLTLFIKKLDSVTRWLVIMGWIIVAISVWQSVQVRYLVPALPLLSIPIAWAVENIKKRLSFPRAILSIFLLSLFIIQMPFLIMSWHKDWLFTLREIPFSVVWGEESRESYLTAQLESFPAFEYIDRNLPKEARIFVLMDVYQALTDRVLAETNYSQLANDLTLHLIVSLSNPQFKNVNINIASHHGKSRWVRIKPLEESQLCWYVHDIKVFERKEAIAASAPSNFSSAEIPRAKWKAHSNRFLAKVNYAFDPSILTYWGIMPPAKSGTYFTLDLGDFYDIEKLVYVTREPNCEIKHQVELSKDNENWELADTITTQEDHPTQGNLFTEGLREIRKRGFNYLYFNACEGEEGLYPLLRRIRSNAKDSDLKLLFNRGNTYLYEIRAE